MQSKSLMRFSAVTLGLLGLALLFAPDEATSALRLQAGQGFVLQLLGGAMIAIAQLNWMSREATLGGFYGRPIVLTNAFNGMVGALILVREVSRQPNSFVLWIFCSYFVFYGAGFVKLLFTNPKGPE